jgi:hypothetical protein
MATIPTLQIPQMGAVSGGADFAPLAQLGTIYAKARQDEADKQALAAFQQTGDPKALMSSGNMSLAQLGINAQNHLDTLRQQGIENKRADINLGINQTNASINRDRANREKIDWENEPDPGSPEALARAAAGIKNKAQAEGEAELADRKAKAAAAGYEPGSAEYRQFMAVGTVPRPAATTADYGTDLVGSLADRLEAGDASWKTGLARVPGLIQAVETEVAKRGVASKTTDPTVKPAETILQNRANQAGRVKEQGTLGTASANNTLYGNAAASTMQTAIEMSAKVPRTSYVPLNRLIQSGQEKLSNPDLAELRTATNTLVSDYAKAITPVGVPTEGAREHARELLDMATDHETFTRVVKLMHREIENTHKAIDFTKKQLQSGKGGGIPPLDAAAPAAPAAGDNLAAAKWARDNPNDPRAQAIIQHLRGQ